MKRKVIAGALLLVLTLLWSRAASAQESTQPAVCFYRDGQATPATRTVTLSGMPQSDAEVLLAELLAGPTRDEQEEGLTSALPPGAELLAVTISGQQVVVDLHIPLDFLHTELDPYLSDAIVKQIVRTLEPLDLYHFQVRAMDEKDNLVPISDFLRIPPLPVPTIPDNDEPLPDSTSLEPRYSGQPPAFGQGQPQGALTGTAAWLSAGHGWNWSDYYDSWATDRYNYHDLGIVEDLSNAEAVNYYLARYLWNAGADMWLVRDWGMNEHEIIVDNDDGAPAYATTGSWVTSTTPGYAGGTYQWSSTYSTRTASASWTPDLPEAGWYPVWAWYRHAINRPFDARYEIHHAGGVTPVSISQEIHGMTWRYLGEYYFEAGTAGHVTLISQSDEYDPSQAVIADAIRFGGGLGSIEESGVTSNRPRWEEAAKYWVMYQGAPEEVYIDDDGDTNDVIARPRYAEWEAAKGEPGEGENAVFISWHTNGYNGTLTGTESYIHSTEPTTGSVELQDWVHAELISDLRAAWDPGWVNRGQKSANFGELRELATMPGVLLEIAFHDSVSDTDALREPVFRQIAARAVYQGIVKYQAQRLGVPIHLLPEPPERLAARNSAPGEATLTWAPPPCCDGVVGDAATAYKVYHSTNGRGFDNGVVTSSTSLTLNGLPSGSLHFFRVTALNDGGESFPTPVVAVRTPASGQLVDFLIVDGFDRLDQTAMISQWENVTLGTVERMFLERMHSYDYAVEHGQALSACNRAFDGAVNEAIEAGDVALAGYGAVDWFTGEDSVADASLSDVERALLADYLGGGGRLLISGAEIGYDLVEYGRDPAFFRDYLRADYRGDDAGTYQFSGVPGGIFDGLAGRFDDSTHGTYDVGYPDRVAPLAGSTLAMSYSGGTADGAAVSYDGDFGVVYMGFPLETVTDPTVRAGLVCAAADYLVPAPLPLEGTPRIINPGFEQGLGQSAWQASASDGNQIFYDTGSLPAYVQPYSGDWLAWLGSLTPGLSVTATLTQVVALPSGDPAAALSLAAFVHPGGASPGDDRLSVRIYDPTGTLKAELLTLTGGSPADVWQMVQFDLSAYSGETIQVVLSAVSAGTAFFVDDVSLVTAGATGPDEFRALWADAYRPGIKSRKQIDELVETAQAGNFNAVVVQVRRRGDTYYPSEIDPWAPDAATGFDALAYLIERAHAAGIEVHAWATTLAIWGGDVPPTEPSHTFNMHGPGATGRDYWLMTSNTGDEQASDLYWLDPGHPDVVDYTVAIYAELASKYDLDGLHLDRVRYAWQEWGYNPTSLSRFQAQTGRTDVPEPTDTQWLQWRRNQVTALVRKIYLTTTEINPRLRVSAALSAAGWPPTDTYPWETRTPYTHQLQDWRSWLEEGLVDIGLTMTYKDDETYAGAFDNWIVWQKDHQYGRGVVVGTGLYLNSVPASMSQWLRVRQPSPSGNHVLGITGYSYGTSSNDGTPRRSFVNSAVTEVFDQSASTPFIGWKDAPTLGHLMGTLSQVFPCPGMNLDGYPLTLSGPANRQLLTDGSGWFGAVDLPPGRYQISVDLLNPDITIQVPVDIAAGVVTERLIYLPGCASHKTYLPLILKEAGP